MLFEHLKGPEVGAGRDLDNLCHAVADLPLGQSGEKGRVKYGMTWFMVRPDSVLQPIPVDGDSVRDGCINESDKSCRDPDVRRGSAVDRTSKSFFFSPGWWSSTLVRGSSL